MPLCPHICLLYAICWLILADNPEENGFLSARLNNVRYCFNLFIHVFPSFPGGGRQTVTAVSGRSGAARRQNDRQKGAYFSPAASSTLCSSTFAPFSAQVGRIFSASLWLIPFSQGMKIMLAGATLLI